MRSIGWEDHQMPLSSTNLTLKFLCTENIVDDYRALVIDTEDTEAVEKRAELKMGHLLQAIKLKRAKMISIPQMCGSNDEATQVKRMSTTLPSIIQHASINDINEQL
jgi:hypothetical protein